MNTCVYYFARLIVQICFFTRENQMHDEVFRLCHKACWSIQHWPCNGGKLLVIVFYTSRFPRTRESYCDQWLFFITVIFYNYIIALLCPLVQSIWSYLDYLWHVLCMIFLYCQLVFDCFLFLIGKHTRNRNLLNVDLNKNSFVNSTFLMYHNQTSYIVYHVLC